MRSSLLAVAACVLTACTPPVWTHQSKGQPDWDVDLTDCRRDARMVSASGQPQPGAYQQPSYAPPGPARSEAGAQIAAMGNEMDWTDRCLIARGWSKS